jgi:hypothetical protein
MAVHSTALVANRHVGQLMRRLEKVSAPDMRMVVRVQIDTLMLRTLDADRAKTGDLQAGTQPAGQVLVGGLLKLTVQVVVVKR